MGLEIEGNAALVAASSSGLGKASAQALADAGANVVINGRDPERAEATADELRANTAGSVAAYAADLTEPEEIEALVEQTIEQFGGLDHLVTNAGGPPSGSFLELSESDWYHAFDLLVMSVVRLVQAASEPLRADGGGTIVNITSRSVKEAIDGLVLSNSVRMGVIGLEKTLSTELAPEVRANAVLPGPHETERQQNLIEAGVERGDYDSYEAGLAARSADIPAGRLGDPGELGDVVAFLSSPRSSYVNGVAVPVDGGLSDSNL